MQTKAVGFLLSIEGVAKDGITKSLLVCTVHTQLVGTPRMGNQSDSPITQSLILRKGRLPVVRIHHLTGTVQRIGAKGQVYHTAARHFVFQHGDILWFVSPDELTIAGFEKKIVEI